MIVGREGLLVCLPEDTMFIAKYEQKHKYMYSISHSTLSDFHIFEIINSMTFRKQDVDSNNNFIFFFFLFLSGKCRVKKWIRVSGGLVSTVKN
jgi:hypothetical protein